jgi:lysophospholipase L1-like esterase
MRVLVFGDSISQGFWDTEGGWVARLRKYYDARQLEDLRSRNEPTLFNLGISGGTSSTILDRFDNETQARRNDEEIVIVISTGLNDSYREGSNNYRSTPEEYGQNLQELAAKAKAYSNKILFVGLVASDESKTTPVFWRDIYYLNERIKVFEDIMQKVAVENNLSFVPVFEEFKKRTEAGTNLLADGLHPNNEGHELISQLVKPELDKLVNT